MILISLQYILSSLGKGTKEMSRWADLEFEIGKTNVESQSQRKLI